MSITTCDIIYNNNNKIFQLINKINKFSGVIK